MSNLTIRALLELPDENTPQESRHQSPAHTIDLVSAPASPQSIIYLSSDDDDEIVFLEEVGIDFEMYLYAHRVLYESYCMF